MSRLCTCIPTHTLDPASLARQVSPDKNGRGACLEEEEEAHDIHDNGVHVASGESSLQSANGRVEDNADRNQEAHGCMRRKWIILNSLDRVDTTEHCQLESGPDLLCRHA